MHDNLLDGSVPGAPVGSYRLWDTGTTWLDLETSPGLFDWTPLDTAVAAAEQADARPLLVLGQTPEFHASRPSPEAAYGPSAGSMPDLDAWRRYVRAVAERYGNRIDYQTWNEPNVIQFWDGTPQQMAQLTLVAAETIRDVVPRATIVAPSFPLRLAGQRHYFEDFWGLQSQRVDLAGDLDVAAVHLYPLAEEAPEAQAQLLDFARRALAANGVDLPVWNTEINFGLVDGPPLSPELQRAYVMRTYLLNAGLGVERVYWYRWDISPIANTFLTQPDLTTETLAGQSLDLVRRWLLGTRPEGCSPPDSREGTWSCTVRAAPLVRTFLWRPVGPPAPAIVRNARTWTDATGRSTPCDDRCRIPVGATPVMVIGEV